MAEQQVEQPKPLQDYYNPTVLTNISPIRLPEVTAAHYAINAHLLQLLPEFHGLNDQNPYHHLNAFFSICATFKIQNMTDDALRLILFPFSLKDKAKQWLDSLTPNSITTWTQLESVFLKKYFPIGKTNQIRRAITSFVQNDGEEFHEAWERLKDLTRACPHHNIHKWQLVQAFYDGLNQRNREFVDASCGGTFMHRSEEEAWELFENLSDNSIQHAQSGQFASPLNIKAGVYGVNATSELNLKVDTLTRQVSKLLSEINPYNRAQPSQEASYYSVPPQEHVNALNDPGSSSYHPGMANHPNYPRGSNNSSNSRFQEQRPSTNNYNNPYGAYYNNYDRHFQQSSSQDNTNNEEPFNLEREFREMKKVVYETRDLAKDVRDLTQRLNNHEQAFRKLEVTVGQLAATINQREKGKLPSQPEQQSRDAYEVHERSSNEFRPLHINAVTTLRSGRKVDNGIGNTTPNDQGDNEIPPPPPGEPFVPPLPPDDEEEQPNDSTPPFPNALKDPSPPVKIDKYKDTMDIFKQVQVNIPLLDAIKQIPAYAKFIKDLCTKKRKTQKRVPKRVVLTEHVSSIIQNSLPQKYKDPGAPTIPCMIGNQMFEKALLDLGASVNLIPYSVYEQLDLGTLRPTKVTLQLADRSIRIPRGVVEDVLIKIDKFVFPVDFVVLDMEIARSNKNQIPMILGRPFLATADAKINCRTGLMKISFGNLKAKLNVFNLLENSSEGEVCSLVDAQEKINPTPNTRTNSKRVGPDAMKINNHSSRIIDSNAILEPG